MLLAADQRKFDGTYFASQAECVPAHDVISGSVAAVGVSVRIQLPTAAPSFAPVARVVTLMMPFAPMSRPATYVVAIVEQPATSAVPGQATFVETYSLTDVLQAAAAATPSDIF